MRLGSSGPRWQRACRHSEVSQFCIHLQCQHEVLKSELKERIPKAPSSAMVGSRFSRCRGPAAELQA